MKLVYKHLNSYHRCTILTLQKEGLSMTAIALHLGIHKSTISREIARNGGLFNSHETIYKYIWQDKKTEGELYLNLRHRDKKYNKRGSKLAGRGLIPGRIDIDQRPKIVDLKSRIGDIEADLIVGAEHKGAILSLVDRHSKYTKLCLLKGKTMEEVTPAIIRALKSNLLVYVFKILKTLKTKP